MKVNIPCIDPIGSGFFKRIAIPPKNNLRRRSFVMLPCPSTKPCSCLTTIGKRWPPLSCPRIFRVRVCPVKFGWRFPIKVGDLGENLCLGRWSFPVILDVFFCFLAGSGHGNEKWMDLWVFLGKPKGITLKKGLFCLWSHFITRPQRNSFQSRTQRNSIGYTPR